MRLPIIHRSLTIDHYLALLLLAISFFLFRPILGPVWYAAHDTTHIARVYLMEQTIRDGQFPPVWAEGINNGLGYPLFHFYAPLFSYLTLIIKQAVGSYFVATKIALIGTAFLGMWGMYRLTRGWGRGPAALSAVAFGTLPYAALNLYVRGAYAEYLAIALLPWLFAAWQNLSSLRRQLITAVVTTIFLLAHNLIPLISLPFLVIWIMVHHHTKLRPLILPSLTTLLLSAFYLLPLLFERSFVQADQVATTTNYALHFVAPWQLWNSTWGFGGSVIGVEDGLSFKLGKVLVLLSLGSLLLLFRRRSTRLLHFFVPATLLAAFMTTSFSRVIWERVGILAMVQFPWRFLALTGFFLAALAGLSLNLIRIRFWRLAILVLTISALLMTNLKLFVPQSTFSADLSRYTSGAYLATLHLIIPEYLPRYLPAGPTPPHDQNSRAYYPTWVVTVDGHRVPTSPDGNGLLTYPNPTNSPNVVLRQSHTVLEQLAFALSVVTLIGILLAYVPWKIYVKT